MPPPPSEARRFRPPHNRRGGVPAAPEKIQNSTADSPRLQPPQTYGHPPQHLFRTEFLSPDLIVLQHGDDVHVADDIANGRIVLDLVHANVIAPAELLISQLLKLFIEPVKNPLKPRNVFRHNDCRLYI